MYRVKSNLDTREEGIHLENCSAVACKRKQPWQAFKGARGWLVSRTLLNPFFVAGLKGWNYGPFEGALWRTVGIAALRL